MKDVIKIMHNNRCSKSRCALDFLEKKKIDIEIVEYLKTPLTEKEIRSLLKMLGLKAPDIVRKGEDLFKQKFKNKKLTEAEWIKILAKNPVLIERPIIIKGNKAIVGRPPELVLDFI